MNAKHKLAEIERIAADILASARASGYDGPVGLINILNAVEIYNKAASEYMDWGGTFLEYQYTLVKCALFWDTPYYAYMAHGYYAGFKYSRIVNYVRVICREYDLSINLDQYLEQYSVMSLVSNVIAGLQSKDTLVDSIIFEYFD